MASKAIVIINPKAGSARGWPIYQRLEEGLCRMGYKVSVWPSQHGGHVHQLALRAKDTADLVAVVGGDGTVAEVANGLAYSRAPLLIVPTGTENIIANELGLGNVSRHLEELLRRGRAHPVDLGCVNGRYFLAVLGAGFDADVIERVHAKRSGHITHLSYFWPIWRTFWEYRFPAVRVEADGELICDGPALVFVGNTARYAVGLRILRDARFDDGLLDLCVYPCHWQGRLLLHSLTTMLQVHPERRSVIYRRCRNVVISSGKQPLRMQIDGDPGGLLPARIEVCPGALHVLMWPDER
ncbi:MAG: diacylglycerol kinase family lipid kinase [Phycisphaerae bacterium]|nr:diacylglycerol kinase family lipid kinase [Phycisphaerae bacterium]